MWRKSIASSIKLIGCSINNRVMAVKVKCDHFEISLCNVFLSCFEQSEEYSVALMECFSYIDHVYKCLMKQHNRLELYIIGDYNVDVQKYRIIDMSQV